jgi:hypothetical protein
MADYPGWYQDPTGRHPERYFDSNGIPTQLVRRNGASSSWTLTPPATWMRLHFPRRRRYP